MKMSFIKKSGSLFKLQNKLKKNSCNIYKKRKEKKGLSHCSCLEFFLTLRLHVDLMEWKQRFLKGHNDLLI